MFGDIIIINECGVNLIDFEWVVLIGEVVEWLVVVSVFVVFGSFLFGVLEMLLFLLIRVGCDVGVFVIVDIFGFVFFCVVDVGVMVFKLNMVEFVEVIGILDLVEGVCFLIGCGVELVLFFFGVDGMFVVIVVDFVYVWFDQLFVGNFIGVGDVGVVVCVVWYVVGDCDFVLIFCLVIVWFVVVVFIFFVGDIFFCWIEFEQQFCVLYFDFFLFWKDFL